MPVVRELPDDLVRQLRRARSLELLADGEDQRQRAVYGTASLLAAAQAAGWLIKDLAVPLGISADTASKRINDARRAGRHHHGGLVIDEPAEIRPVLAEFDTPEEDREWLTRSEAAAYAGVAPRTISGWSDRGLLPHTRIVGRRWRAYLRADLRRACTSRASSRKTREEASTL